MLSVLSLLFIVTTTWHNGILEWNGVGIYGLLLIATEYYLMANVKRLAEWYFVCDPLLCYSTSVFDWCH
jgi:hypothetical protein